MTHAAAFRPGAASDAVDGVVPAQVAEPDTADALAATLAHAAHERRTVVIRGGGTKIDWGRTPAAVDLLVGTSRLNRIIAHRHGDLTATVQPGLRLSALNAALRAQQQWLPVESAFEDATLGGVVATNDCGPSRHRNGTPRDLVIGITLALTDGRLVKAGGTVVKNVAGYDLGKLMSGSHGSLAAIADLTFKLVPIPHASATLVASYTDEQLLVRDAGAISGSQIEPAAFDIRVEAAAGSRTALALLIRFASSPSATDAQVAAARALLSVEAAVVSGADETRLWEEHIRAPWSGDGAVVRLSWLPTGLPDVLALTGEIARISAGSVALVGRGAGGGLLRVQGTARAQIEAITLLRNSRQAGHVVVLRAPADVKRAVDVWGPPPDSAAVARALKAMFDPAGILNANRGPV
jgi:glycolate oxidase FAD binding subunit